MVINKFMYMKETTGAPNEYELLLLNKDEEHINGLSVGGIPLEEREAIIAIVKKYEEDLKPYMKYYRNFKKEKMIVPQP